MGRVRAVQRPNRARVSAVVLGIVGMVGCGTGATGLPIAARDSAGVRIVENDLSRLTAVCAVDSIPAVRIGVVEGEEAYQLHRVFGATRLSDGRIALVNQGSQELRYYDSNGRFLASAGRAGQGPGEFSDAFYLWRLPGDTLYVGDYRPWQFEVFDSDGHWLRMIQPDPAYGNPPDEVGVLDDRRSLIAMRDFPRSPATGGFTERTIVLALHGVDGRLVDTIGRYPNGRWGRLGTNPNEPTMYPHFESFTRMAARGERVILSHMSRPELQVSRVGSTILPELIVRWAEGDRTIHGDDIEAERVRIADLYADMPAQMRTVIVDPLLSPNRPVADSFPAFASIQIGMDGRLWVHAYRRPGGDEVQDWMGFSTDGTYACRLTPPVPGQVLEFGQDYMLLLHQDEVGVERVVEYSIGPPTN